MRKSISQSVQEFQQDLYKSPDILTQTQAGWIEWNCNTKELFEKTKELFEKLQRILDVNKKFNPDKTRLMFRNNERINENLFDSISICDIDTLEVLYWITISRSLKNDELYYNKNDFMKPLVSGNWEDIINYFKGV